MKISEITETMSQGTIRLNGMPVAARVLSSHQDEFLRRLLPQPQPTKEKPTPVRGAVVMEPDRKDPAYRRAVSEWAVRFACLELAVACRLELDSGLAFEDRWIGGDPDDNDHPDADEARKWCEGVVDELAGGLSRRVIDDAIEELRGLEAGAVARAYAHLLGIDPDDLDDVERRRCRINVAAGANTVAVAAELAKRYSPHDLAAWWDNMPIGQRAMTVALELFLNREE